MILILLFLIAKLLAVLKEEPINVPAEGDKVLRGGHSVSLQVTIVNITEMIVRLIICPGSGNQILL